jgi:G3E family GTPase
VAFAYIIIFNKIDLVSAEYLQALEGQILSHNSAATIVRATRAEVDLDSILNINAFDMTRALDIDPHLKSSCCSDAEKVRVVCACACCARCDERSHQWHRLVTMNTRTRTCTTTRW